MTKTIIGAISLGVLILYVALVALFGFPGTIALGVHFGRVAIAMAVLILYFPAVKVIFEEVPAPRRDYLVSGIILTWLSGSGFSLWNEAGRLFNVDTSIFTSPIAGFFSLLLLTGGIFHLVAPVVTTTLTKRTAIIFGLCFSALLVFVAPLFR